MLRSLKIENFRCFQTFELQQLGRLNLLVGTNNSGKTSILEAVQLLCSQNFSKVLQEMMIGRGEYNWLAGKGNNKELDIRHLFYGHEIKVGSEFSIFGSARNIDKKLVLYIVSSDQVYEYENTGSLTLAVHYFGSEDGWEDEAFYVPLSTHQSLSTNFREEESNPWGVKTQYVTTSSLTNEDMMELFDQIVLMPEEDMIIESLQIIEPRVERIASVGSGKSLLPLDLPGGLIIRLASSNQRIPLGNMGDGMRRILGLTLAIVNARDGVLLVDEIDAGLHYSAMSDMWKLIWETAKRLNVQVFATTHNSDCWTSLAAIANTENPSEEGITIQRIEKDKPSSIVFTERQVVIAAERGIEVR